LCSLFSVPPYLAEETNYCHDPEAEAQGLALRAENPKDCELYALHALRIGLRQRVDQGMLTVEETPIIFEQAASALVEQQKWKKMERGKKKALAKLPDLPQDLWPKKTSLAGAHDGCILFHLESWVI
jgi:hypothetical protein